MKFNEQATVENYIIKYLQDKLGYEYIKPEDFAPLREFENEYLIIPHLEEAISRINQIEDKTEIQSVIREIKKLDTNEEFLEAMRSGIDLVDSQTRKTKNYKLVYFNPSTDLGVNKLVVTNQFYFAGDSENIRPDIMIFLNGLPIIDIEAKSPTASSNVNYEKAIDQIKRYQKNAAKLFLTNCFNIATDGLKTYYGATGSSKQYYFQWKENDQSDKQAQKTNTSLDITLDNLLAPAKLLDIIQNFIVFEKAKEKTVKKIARYQQVRATNKIIQRVSEGKNKRGLIWHTQGSGKSLTMFFTAWKLRFREQLKNPKVFVLVDRIDLDDQITNNFVNCGGKNVIRVTSKENLRQKITNDERGIFISTIHKFNDLPADTANPDENIIVLCDEGHRTQEGFASINLHASMTNAFFFGFTGTPIDRVTLNTHQNFGEEGERYLDYYSIQQAIDDGATLPVTYEARLSKFFLDEEQIDKQFDELAADLGDKEREELTKKYGKKDAIVKLEKRMRAVIQDIVEHYRAYVLPNGFKAQIVCSDREATAKYKELLDELVSPEWSEVIYSPGDPNSDSDDLQKYNKNKEKRDQVIEKFKDPESELKFLLVCDMLLTGFDAPIEQAMYLDKSLRDHNLLQAIARTNRVYPNKGCGKIIDYYGITKNLYQALNFDESVVEEALIDLDRLKEEFTQVLKETLDIFTGIDTEDPSLNNLRRVLKIFIDNENKQQFFEDKYKRLKLLFEILSPDPFLKEYMRKFDWLSSFYLAFIKEFRSEDIDHVLFAEFGEKMRALVQNSVEYGGVTKTYRELKVHDLYNLERLDEMDDDEKALNLEKMLKREIAVNIDTNPAFIKFSERLSAIKEEFEQNQIDLDERIKRYQKLMEDIRSKNQQAKEMGYNLKEYGLYLISEDYIDMSDQKLVREFIKEMTLRIADILDEGWQESSKREQFIKEIKRTLQKLVLKDYKGRIEVKDFTKYINRLVDVILKKF